MDNIDNSLDKPVMNSYDMVKEFHQKFNHPVVETGADLSEEGLSNERLELRVNLIAEEFFELVGAAYSPKARAFMELCWRIMLEENGHTNSDSSYTRDLIEVADALGDMEYVINGFAHEAGIDLPKVMREIHDSNMSKLGEDGKPIYRDSDGKILKGPNFYPPNIRKVLFPDSLEKDN